MPAALIKVNPAPFAVTPADVTISRGSTSLVSAFRNGYTHTQDELRTDEAANNTTAVLAARTLLQNDFYYLNQHIKGWGPADPWPTPGTACPIWNDNSDSRWASWDLHISILKAIQDARGSGELIVTLCQAPWWMYGHRVQPADSITGTETQLISDANSDFSSHTTTQSFTRTDRHALDGVDWVFPNKYVNPDMAVCRVLDDQMTNWATLCYNMAKRAMNKYGVRKFQIWNELKGYFHPAGDGTTNSIHMDMANTWDGGLSAGVGGSGPHATHGYTFMYNAVYAKLRQAATELSVTVKIGGPYVSHGLLNAAPNNGSVSQTTETGMTGDHTYGYHDDRTIQVVKFWLANKTGADYLLLRASVKCQDLGTARPSASFNIFNQQTLYADLLTWVRGLNNTTYPGAATLPVIMSEWYSYQNPVSSNTQWHAAFGAVAHINWINAGGEVMLRWGGRVSEDNLSLWSPTNAAGGGQSTPLEQALALIGANFSSGTQLYAATIDDTTKLRALVSLTKMLLVNLTNATLKVDTGAQAGLVSLGAYEVRVV